MRLRRCIQFGFVVLFIIAIGYLLNALNSYVNAKDRLIEAQSAYTLTIKRQLQAQNIIDISIDGDPQNQEFFRKYFLEHPKKEISQELSNKIKSGLVLLGIKQTNESPLIANSLAWTTSVQIGETWRPTIYFQQDYISSKTTDKEQFFLTIWHENMHLLQNMRENNIFQHIDYHDYSVKEWRLFFEDECEAYIAEADLAQEFGYRLDPGSYAYFYHNYGMRALRESYVKNKLKHLGLSYLEKAILAE